MKKTYFSYLQRSLAMDEAIKAKHEGKEKVILFNLSGHGLLDLNGYDKFLHKKL